MYPPEAQLVKADCGHKILHPSVSFLTYLVTILLETYIRLRLLSLISNRLHPQSQRCSSGLMLFVSVKTVNFQSVYVRVLLLVCYLVMLYCIG